VSTTLLLMVTSAAGVYQMADHQRSSRQGAYRDLIGAEISGRMSGAYGVLRTTVDDPALGGESVQEHRRILSAVTLDNAEYLRGMAMLDASGAVLESWPADGLAPLNIAELGFAETSATLSPFVWVASADGGASGNLWAQVSVPVVGGEPRRLVGLLRTEFVGRILADLAELPGAPTALVFDADEAILFAGNEQLPADVSAVFRTDEDGRASGVVSIEGAVPLEGPYVGLNSPRGLGWMVAVVEDPAVVWRDTWHALMPGILGWLAALVIALVASLAVVTRVTRPLRSLERRATALASGLVIEAEPITAHDEIGRLLEAFNHVAERLNRLNEVARLLASESDRGRMLGEISASVSGLLGGVDVDVLLLDDERLLEVVSAHGALADRQGLSFDPEDIPWISAALTSGAVTEAYRATSDAFLALHGPNALWALAVPLLAATEVIGVGVVVRHGGSSFTQTESETARSFAAQVSVALQNSRLFEGERRAREEAEALREIAECVAAAAPIDETLVSVARMEGELLGLEAPAVALRDRAVFGLVPAEDPSLDRIWFGTWDTITREGSDAGIPQYVPASDARPGVARVLRDSGARGALLTPLERASGVEGLLVLLVPESSAVPSASRLALARTVAKQASLALENAFLYQQAMSRADNLETIFRISHAVGSSLQSRIVLNRVLDVVQKILSADAVMLMTYDAQRKQITVPMARGILNRDMLDAVFRLGEDVPGRVFETREPERYDRISNADTRLLNSAAEQGLESLLAVPLLARGRSVGVLVVLARAAGAFTSEELDLLRTFASQAALAIDNAEMFSREHHRSTILQESILPSRLPRIEGIEASSVYLPAGTDSDIGGDYYDLFTAPDGRVVVSIGDVCGKGVEAATKTSMIRYALRGMVIAGLEPGRVLTELNDMLLEVADAASIVTVWLGYIDLAAGTLVYADGGHPPGLLLRPSDGSIRRLSTTGALLGAVSGTTWGQEETALEVGSTLLLYTDGVTEARRGTRFFGEGRVRRALRAGGSPSSVSQRLLAHVQRFSAGELRDDAAILAVSYAPSIESVDVSLPAGSGK